MNISSQNKVLQQLSIAFVAGGIAGAVYNFCPSQGGYAFKQFYKFVKHTTEGITASKDIQIIPGSPFLALQQGDIYRALKNIDKLESHLQPYFFNALNSYKNLEKAKSRVYLAEIFAKSLNKPVSSLKKELKTNFQGVFKEYFSKQNTADYLNKVSLQELATRLKSYKKYNFLKTSMVGLLATWLVYKLLRTTNKSNTKYE